MYSIDKVTVSKETPFLNLGVKSIIIHTVIYDISITKLVD